MTDENSDSTAVVDEQLRAYETGDTDAFAACFAEDAVVAGLADGTVHAEGRAEIREEWADLFEQSSDLCCEVRDRISMGPFVVCNERVTGTGERVDALAVYYVENGLIARLWLGYA